jgi:hypothetical protein
MPNAKTAREIVIRFISGGPTRIDKAKCAENKLKLCVSGNSIPAFASESQVESRLLRATPIFSSNAQEFVGNGWGLSERHAKPRKFGLPTSNGCSACRENDLIRRVR